MRTVLYLNAVGEISGAERSLLALLEALDRDAWRPVVAAPEGTLLREAHARGAAVMPVALAPLRRPRAPAAGLALLGALHAGWREVAAVVRTVQPDLLHANTTAAMCYALRVRVPRIWQVRDLVPLGAPGAVLYRQAARVAAISAAVRAALLPYADDGGEKIRPLPPAVDTARFHPAADTSPLRTALGLPADVPLIGLIAQLVPWKRHGLFLDALERLLQRPWHAVLAGAELHGDRAYADRLRARVAAPPLAGRVSWLPWQADAAPLLAALDILALTSEREPFGRVLIEALACGVPAVAVADGGPTDILRPDETGLLVPPDAAALADALAALLADPARRAALGAAGRADVEARFSVTRQRAALAALYDEVVGEAA
ncbi:MAG TPA: glycosyltransferase [Armatimonadota bacterium]|nr:glycosyltransferase [Armatimonadota bacterium]HOS43342.1 glycosyltransferase [Armatimonadota bacterium]